MTRIDGIKSFARGLCYLSVGFVRLFTFVRASGFGFWVLGGFGAARVFCPFECIVRLSLKCSLGARVEPVFQFLNVEF